MKLDPRLEVGVKVCRARKKTAGCTAGPAERILRLRGNLDGAVKPLRAWKLCSEPESEGHPGSPKTCGRGRTGVGSGVAAEAGGWDADNSGVRMRSLGERQAVRGGGESAVVWSKGAREAVEPR